MTPASSRAAVRAWQAGGGPWDRLVCAVCSLLLAWGLLRPPPGGLELPGESDKLLHFLAFAVFAVAWLRVSDARGPLAARPLVWAGRVLAWCLVWAAASEWLQRFVPGRSGDVLDAVADFLGALAAVGGYVPWARRVVTPAAAE